MNKDMTFKQAIDRELSDMEFNSSSKAKVLDRISKPRSRFQNLLEKEIAIPVTPFAAALLISVTVFAYTLSGSFRVTEDDIKQSRIVVENLNGGNSSEIYKD